MTLRSETRKTALLNFSDTLPQALAENVSERVYVVRLFRATTTLFIAYGLSACSNSFSSNNNSLVSLSQINQIAGLPNILRIDKGGLLRGVAC